ncbi:MAG TPA: amine dehydrogenase large subunit [Steroidobacteraceae bacterium]
MNQWTTASAQARRGTGGAAPTSRGIARHPGSALGFVLGCLGLSLGACHAWAALPIDPLIVEQLPARSSPHWVWVNDFSFAHVTDGRAVLIDADRGQLLGMLSTGYNFVSVVLPRDGSVVYAPETYFARGTRGVRTDVITLYDPRHLTPTAEIPIPPKRASAIPMPAQAVLTDDDRFLLIYNFTPAQSTSVVDTRSRKFIGELDTAGCALLYPTGARDFFAICADGGLLSVTLDDSGHAAHVKHAAPLFDPQKDPLSEKAVRSGTTWYFVSFDSEIYPIQTARHASVLLPRWSLASAQERKEGWRTGGLQQIALQRAQRRLYVIMHQGGRNTHKDPGKEIWVFDLATKLRVQRIAMKNPVTSIEVSQDDRPLLYAAFLGSGTLDIYDALTGQALRSVADVAATPTLLVTP